MSHEIVGDLDVKNNISVGGGLKDANVTTPIKLGSPTDTSFNTIKKDIIGAVNEVLASIGGAASFPDFIRQKVDFTEQIYTKDNKILNGYNSTKVCVGIVDNLGKPILYM